MRFFISLIVVLALAGCQSNGASDVADTGSAAETSAAPAMDHFDGTVIETMNAGGYTYVHVDTGSEKIWAAGPQQTMEVGTAVKITKSMPMQNFRSPALEREFEVLYFVGEFGDHEHSEGEAASGGMPADHGSMGGAMAGGHGGMGGAASAGEAVDFSGIAPADQTVAAVYDGKDALAGKPVKVRGKVVKSLTGIMGTNWLHIQDGTGEAGSNDLTVTTSGTAPVGATVVVEGVLGVDRDFGSGYRYGVIIEDAQVTIE